MQTRLNPLRRFADPLLVTGAAALFALAACQKEPLVQAAIDNIPRAYVDSTLEHPQLIYTNGDTSLNDCCPVRKAKLNLRLPAVFVNGRQIGFC